MNPSVELPLPIPIVVSARHVHLCQASIDVLFGVGHVLQVENLLRQAGQFIAVETVDLVGSRGSIPSVRIAGPPRSADQVEISRTDQHALGVAAPPRQSGDLDATPGLTLRGPRGELTLERGVITAVRHLHCSPEEAQQLGLADGDRVAVAVGTTERAVLFGQVRVRVAPGFRLELHIDTDEGRSAGVQPGDTGVLVAGRS